MKYVFETSWEICNKVGGIHTVVASKAEEALKAYQDNYIAIGPDLGKDDEFEEINDDPFFNKLKDNLAEANPKCRFGKWKIPGSPRPFLVGGFKERFDVERLLHTFWQEFGLDSYEGSWDYVEPTLFSTTAAELIEVICKTNLEAQDTAVAHFHEWICGAGVLYLKKNMPKVGTVFTTHATTLGRSMAQNNSMYYHELELSTNIDHKAYVNGVKSKHSLEAIAARNADCFTTVSEFTGREAFHVLNTKPDLIVYNGLNQENIDTNNRGIHKKQLLDKCSEFLAEDLPENTQIWLSSGRYEFKNKGYDLCLDSLARLNSKLPDNHPPVLMLFLVAADHTKVNASYELPKSGHPDYRPVAISPVYNADHDQILNAAKYHGLDKKSSKVRTIFSTQYMDGADGIFNLTYDQILSCTDLTLFPSFYEPWGYTPLESALKGVPTITSDLAGFGHWVHTLEGNWSKLVKVLNRKNRTFEDASNTLTNLLLDFALDGHKTQEEAKQLSNDLAKLIHWSEIFPGFRKAYEIARAKGYARFVSSQNDFIQNPFKKAEVFAVNSKKEQARFNLLSVEVPLPSKLEKLNELAYNVWSSWDKESRALFKSMNPTLWEYFDHSPMKLLKSIPYNELVTLSEDEDFIQRYEKVYASFRKYMGEISDKELIDVEKPLIAYFSMEYGLHESIPIYAGGLGILSGDHMKGASDMNMNMVGIGLFYNEGYFTQEINSDGYQVEHYPQQDWKNLPVKVLLNEHGNQVKIPVEYPNNVVWTRVLVLQVGRIPVLLFDTNIEENSWEDRAITAKLYAGDKHMRIRQEILVATAGVRLLRDIMNVNPAVYHLNEGHCAFIAVERFRRMAQQGQSLQESFDAMRDTTVFTTHTPVPAGNETFELSLIHEMFGHTFHSMQVPIERFLELGRDEQNPNVFSMTVLAINISCKSNAVAQLHGDVAYDMWKHVLPKNDPDYFGYVTNGVHMGSWLGESMKDIYSQEMENISDKIIWDKHQEQKAKFIDFLKVKILNDYSRKGVSLDLIKKIIDGLSEDTLLVGFARRFAEYKRAGLVFSDLDRLQEILANADRPVTLVYAGKAHPNNGRGKEIIQSIYRNVLDERFLGRVILLENYNMHTGRLMTQGCDVWLNNPVMRKEACGTSGMKAAANGVLNLSLPDGWWHEGYKPEIGWSIPPSHNPDYGAMCWDECQAIYKLLQEEVIPQFYNKGPEGYSEEWLKKMRASILHVCKEFSTDRMLSDYMNKMYQFAIENSNKLVTK